MSRDAIDWSKAGKRLRHTPTTPAMGGRNPDWNWVQRRWKVAEEYAGEELAPAEVVDLVPCPREGCGAELGHQCPDARGNLMDHPHAERVFAAGAARIKEGWTI